MLTYIFADVSSDYFNADSDDNQCDYYECTDFNKLNISTPGMFSTFYMNSRSLCRHVYDIQDYLATLNHSFSIYGFTETWFKEAPPSYVHMDNYQLVHSSRSLKLGGGVAMFINSSLNFLTIVKIFCPHKTTWILSLLKFSEPKLVI